MQKIVFSDGTEFEVGAYPVDTEPSIFEKKRLSSGVYRECVRFTVNGNYSDVASKFVNGASYLIRESDGEYSEDFDKSEFCVAGDIVDHRNGTLTVYMGKKTAAENTQETFDALTARVTALGGIDAAEKLGEWKSQTLAKIEGLTPIVRATVKSALGLE